MYNILFGYLFKFINFTININEYELDCLPDFVGYFLIYYGCKSLQKKSKHFKIASYIAIVMSICHIPSYIYGLIGLSFFSEGNIATLLTIAITLASLLLSKCIVEGIRDLETRHATNLYGKTLYDRWLLIAITSVILCCINTLTLSMLKALVASGLMLANGIFHLLFLFTLYKSNNKYKKLGIA